MTTLSTTTCKNSAATSCLHTSAETVYFASLSFLGLVSSFHFSFSFMPALSRQNYPFWVADAATISLLLVWIGPFFDVVFTTICTNKTAKLQKRILMSIAYIGILTNQTHKVKYLALFPLQVLHNFAYLLYINIQIAQNHSQKCGKSKFAQNAWRICFVIVE